MVLLSPPKLLVILVIALIVLGPDKLPSVARRIGAAWSDFTRWRAQLESEVRATFPDLPSTTEVARAVRSPISLLDRLADEHGTTAPTDPVREAPEGGADAPSPALSPPARLSSSGHPPSAHGARTGERQAEAASWAEESPRPDVSSMN
jgi:TatA/E family protein of Tat protein translocase